MPYLYSRDDYFCPNCQRGLDCIPVTVVEASDLTGTEEQGRGDRMAIPFLCSALVSASDEHEYHHAERVVSGDGCAMSEGEKMVRGEMYATSIGGAPSWRYWRCHYDAETMSGAKYGRFTLPVVPLHGMRTTSPCQRLEIPHHIVRGRRGGLSRIEFVSRFIRAWCRKNPGAAVVFRRIVAGNERSIKDLGKLLCGVGHFRGTGNWIA